MPFEEWRDTNLARKPELMQEVRAYMSSRYDFTFEPIPGATMMTVAGDFKTQRDYVEALTKPSQCAGCHSIINPPGFALENYDGIGKWQTTDPRGGAIDASVTTATVDFGDGNSKPISSPLQLMQEIGDNPASYREKLKQELLAELGRTQAAPGEPAPAATAPAPAPTAQIPQSLATARSAGARSAPTWSGPSTLDSILGK